jgi:DNA repair protein RadD
MEIVKAIAYAESIAKSVLVFCSSIKQAEKLQKLSLFSQVVTSKTAKNDRDKIIKQFKAGEIKTVFNVGVLTTGFDHPELDCIVMIRPTRSIALYYQMLGRGVRKAEGKVDCKVIDLSSNVKNLGKIETIGLFKEDGKWELKSEMGSWHNKELYRFTIKREEKPKNAFI